MRRRLAVVDGERRVGGAAVAVRDARARRAWHHAVLREVRNRAAEGLAAEDASAAHHGAEMSKATRVSTGIGSKTVNTAVGEAVDEVVCKAE